MKTLEVPIGGSVSPVDALSLLIEVLAISGTKSGVSKSIRDYDDDPNGDATLMVLKNSFDVVSRITGNDPGSLGLHPAVYFYNERGKYSRFLFLGIIQLIAERVANNDSLFFKKFTSARAGIEKFLLENKSILGIVLQNLSKQQRIPKMKDLFVFLMNEVNSGNSVSTESAISHLGLQGRILDVKALKENAKFTDDTKSMVFLETALKSAIKCPICDGYVDPSKSASYDHIIRVRENGKGDASNAQIVHPYCNSSVKN